MPTATLKIAELKVNGRKVVPDTLVACLADKAITTLDDIRRLGGVPPSTELSPDAELSPEDKRTIERLEAHAYLNLLSFKGQLRE